MRQLGNQVQFDTRVLAADVGGTNTSLALVGRIGRRYDILQRFRYATDELESIDTALDAALSQIEDTMAALHPEIVCISAAGPVRDNRAHLTNVPWQIDGHAIASRLAITTLVINDFTAISHGIPLLDLDDPQQVTPLPHPEVGMPERGGSVQAVVGAGTGLGVGFLVENAGDFVACPSEAGHAGFAPYDELSSEYAAYLRRRGPAAPPGAEQFVSGQAIELAARFFRETGRIAEDSPLAVTPGADEEPAARVARAAAAGDETAARIMRFFVANYARAASDAALHFLPRGGLFLAGGIASKNERWFLEDYAFSGAFAHNYLPHISELLRQIPIYIVKDYAISLYGAAHAAARMTDWRSARVE